MNTSPSAELCVRCKGRLYCGLRYCPILERYKSAKRITSEIKGNEFSGNSPPSVFVSWNDYPNISFAPMSPPKVMENADLLDNPEKWYGIAQEEIIAFREILIRSTKKFNAFSASNPSYELSEMQEMLMASKPTEVEIKLKYAPKVELEFDASAAPSGPVAPMEKFTLTENPKIPKDIDYAVSDFDLKANSALQELYAKEIPVHTLYKLLSAGLLGIQKSRKLVPTRWSITATDSNLSNAMISRIKEFSKIDSYLLFNSNYLDNNFYVLLLPTEWQFEQLEAWQPGSPWAGDSKDAYIISDYEFYKGRTTYADNVTGAYYSARLAVCEYLTQNKKQAGAIIFREIGPDYRVPLGVWQIRENVRYALKQKPLNFYSPDLALHYIDSKFRIPMKFWKSKSALLDAHLKQRRMNEWF